MYADWRERLRDAVTRSGKKHSAIAAEADIDPATLSRILNGRLSPKFETVVRIARASNESIAWLNNEFGFNLSADEQKQVRKVARFLEDAALGRMTDRERMQPNALPSGHTDIPRIYTTRGARAVYEAVGESMLNAGILDRDLLFVKPTRSMREATGKVVVCRVDGAEYVKVLDVRGGRMSLLSRNDRYPPLAVREDHFELIGIVVGRSGPPA
jgi:SOS-response transcriptional repressor LexA